MRHPHHDFRPRRSWGQNFLVNRGAAATIVEAFRPAPHDTVLEIGPGEGILTRLLVERVGHLTVVEIDPLLAGRLRDAIAAPAEGRLRVLEADILALDLAALLDGMGAPPAHRVRVIANLPYNIATAVVLRFLPQGARVSDLLLMVQREVASRILSPPRRKTYGSLSVLCQALARVESVLRLGAGSFRPRPRVDSEVLRFTLLDPDSPRPDPRALSELLHVAFAHRRKTLLNNLGPHLGSTAAETLIRSAGLNPGDRPEALSVADFLSMLPRWRALAGARRATRRAGGRL